MQHSSRIEVILGCMFSGKSTELLRRSCRYEAIGKKILFINHLNDIRTDDSIKTHSNFKKTAKKMDKLIPIIDSTEFFESSVIAIDEAQFFDDLLEFVKRAEKYNKIIIVAGLDGDYKREPIGQILSIIPLCDTVTKLTAMDMVDKDGSIAIYTKRIVPNKEQLLVGSDEMYLAVSRKNYHSNSSLIKNKIDNQKDTKINGKIENSNFYSDTPSLDKSALW